MSRREKQLSAKRRRSRAVLAQVSPASTDEQLRAFYQDRLSLFAKIALTTFVIVIVWVNVMYAAFPNAQPGRYMTVNYFAGGSLLILAVVWRLVLARTSPSLERLFALDVIMMVAVGSVLGFNEYLTQDMPANVYSSFILMTCLVFARVCFVPSSGRRTLVISLGSYGPTIVASAAISLEHGAYAGTPSLAFILGAIGYTAIAVSLATACSRIIFGLRKQVREAQELGQYTLLEKIGEGGMGAVYRARHSMLRRPTAIKLLPGDQLGPAALDRFEREVQLTAALTHPNTIAIYDYGRSPQGQFYYVMEYLSGVDLETLVRHHGAQPIARVVHILSQVCGALSEAHDNNLIHRDIKPANIMLCVRGNVHDVVKVLDFGLVKDLAEADSQSDMIAGTPAYVSPESVSDPARVGPASDLYALGAVAYYLVTGVQVFDAHNPVELCVHHVKTAPTPPSRRTRQPVPPVLESLIMQCLEKSAADRPSNARAIDATLAVLRDSHPWPPDEAARWWQDNPDTSELGHSKTETVGALTVDFRGRRDSE